MNYESRGPWYLLTGLLLGIGLGLAYAWLVSPVAYTNTPPAALRADYKDEYRALISLAFASNGDLGRARARLNLLGDAEPGLAVAAQAQRAAAQNRPEAEVQALALLAGSLGSAVPPEALGRLPTPTDTPSPTVVSPVPQTSPVANAPLRVVTVTPSPGPSPSPTSDAPFTLVSRQLICDPAIQQPLIQIQANDSAGLPISGVLITVTWDDGTQQFYTGLKPEINAGYADFTMTPGTSYTLRLSEGGQLFTGLVAENCQAPGRSYPGSWLLTFSRP